MRLIYGVLGSKGKSFADEPHHPPLILIVRFSTNNSINECNCVLPCTQVRQLLGEIPQTCLYSAFRLVAVTPKGEGDEGEGDVWKGKGDVMNDFVELRSIPAVVARPEKVEVRLVGMLLLM